MTSTTKRILSIDMLRGFAMILMALDHVRDYFHITALTEDPTNIETTTPALFFTRWITHLCAPTFVLLSGTSIYLQSLRKTNSELGWFLIKRGLWLIFIEISVVSLGWSFNPLFPLFYLQVIWAIGISMVVMGVFKLMRLPFMALLSIGLILVFGHNLLDFIETQESFKGGFWWSIFHHGGFAFYPVNSSQGLVIAYPFIAWTGVMLLGYCLGAWYTKNVDATLRKKRLVWLGLASLVFFAILRYTNVYGDPVIWQTSARGDVYTFLSFMNLTKYPPSLLYLAATLGIALLALAAAEKLNNKFSSVSIIFGRTAFFYYILHLYLIHFLATIAYFAKGHTLDEISKTKQDLSFLFVIPGEGFTLWVTYVVWIIVLLLLYPLCKRYNTYKSAHPEKWWLSYL